MARVVADTARLAARALLLAMATDRTRATRDRLRTMGPRHLGFGKNAALALLAAALVVGNLAACGGDGNGGETSSQGEASPGKLESLLLPPSELRLRSEGSLAFNEPVDFVVQGTVLPQGTAPSSAGSQVEEAGFSAGAGEILVPPDGGAPVNLSVAAFDSSDGARQAQDYLHTQDLQQPCLAACSVAPRELTIQGIPGATAVHQVPVKFKLPPYVEPFEAYAVEFTIGKDLFYAHASGDPGDIPASVFEQGALRFYKYARQNSD